MLQDEEFHHKGSLHLLAHRGARLLGFRFYDMYYAERDLGRPIEEAPARIPLEFSVADDDDFAEQLLANLTRMRIQVVVHDDVELVVGDDRFDPLEARAHAADPPILEQFRLLRRAREVLSSRARALQDHAVSKSGSSSIERARLYACGERTTSTGLRTRATIRAVGLNRMIAETATSECRYQPEISPTARWTARRAAKSRRSHSTRCRTFALVLPFATALQRVVGAKRPGANRA